MRGSNGGGERHRLTKHRRIRGRSQGGRGAIGDVQRGSRSAAVTPATGPSEGRGKGVGAGRQARQTQNRHARAVDGNGAQGAGAFLKRNRPGGNSRGNIRSENRGGHADRCTKAGRVGSHRQGGRCSFGNRQDEAARAGRIMGVRRIDRREAMASSAQSREGQRAGAGPIERALAQDRCAFVKRHHAGGYPRRRRDRCR